MKKGKKLRDTNFQNTLIMLSYIDTDRTLFNAESLLANESLVNNF